MPTEGQPLGTTSSERFLAHLARKSFLSLWSFPNVYTDEGRHGANGDGKELCDLLVVFGKHVLIFSDKHCPFPDHADVRVAWARWYRRAVDKSVRQVLGARSFISNYPSRLFLDSKCSRPFPIQLPATTDIHFHLFAVTRGAYDACRKYFGSGQHRGSGSLVINTSVVGADHQNHPFMIGLVGTASAYVHVLDELTLQVLLRELDTVSDLIDYLEKKEQFLLTPGRAVMSTGEEQLVAMYLTHVDEFGQHNFRGVPADVTKVYVDEGHWEEFVKSPQYAAKKTADEISYAWDRFIEHFAQGGEVGYGASAHRDVTVLEQALRVMAAEPRLARRQLAFQFVDVLRQKVEPGSRFLRVGAGSSSDTAYAFLALPRPPFIQTYEDYRHARRGMLRACCMVARLRMPQIKTVVGIACEPSGQGGGSEDLLQLDVGGEHWGPTEEAEAARLQRELGILLDQNVKSYMRHDDEYPVAPKAPLQHLSPSKRMEERARLRALDKLKKKRDTSDD